LKLLVGLFVLMLAIAGAGFFVWRSSPDVKPCVLQVRSARIAPDQSALAEVLEARCESSLTTHVTLRKPSQPEQARADVWVAAGAQSVSLSWDARDLRISSSTPPLVNETSWQGLHVITTR
jgi:hypothetical protein